MTPSRQASFFEPEYEYEVEAARPCAHEIEDGDAPWFGRRGLTDLRAFERAHELFHGQRLAERGPTTQLGDQTHHGVVSAQVLAGRFARGRTLEAVGGAQHRRRESLHRIEIRRRRSKGVQGCKRLAVAKANGLLLHSRRRFHRPAAQTSFEEVDVRATESRVRRAQIRVQVAARAVEPRETEQSEHRLAERRLVKPHASFECERNTEGAEYGLDGSLPALQGRTHDADLLRRDTVANELEDLVTDELECTACPRSLEEAHGTVDCRWILDDAIGEERPFEMCDRGLCDVGEARRELFDAAVGELRQIVDRSREGCERRPAGFVRDRNGDVRPSRKRLQ